MVPTIEARVEIPFVRSDPLPNDDFKRWMDVGHQGLAPYLVKLLDERVIWSSSDGGTVHIRQFIKGHHRSPLATNWKRHWGWQREESIREVLRYKLPMPGGTFETRIREVDVSNRDYRFD